ncbi:hypothetical protein GPL15_13765 [Clostridium sp. MCC353]|uniref:hypothetical protein n=1 Tax=Clostridium sp. MCC353 TaxID=2592646 RepID=UPI001C018C69|nr:hypothetical protein [Clostridium sp. MCC353]MBT9777568.1 hypothetical protein [Clostridium sp. MCC353]
MTGWMADLLEGKSRPGSIGCPFDGKNNGDGLFLHQNLHRNHKIELQQRIWNFQHVPAHCKICAFKRSGMEEQM